MTLAYLFGTVLDMLKRQKIQEKISEILNLNKLRYYFCVFGKLFTETRLSIMLYHLKDIKCTNIKVQTTKYFIFTKYFKLECTFFCFYVSKCQIKLSKKNNVSIYMYLRGRLSVRIMFDILAVKSVAFIIQVICEDLSMSRYFSRTPTIKHLY